jgi:hypothetical protein
VFVVPAYDTPDPTFDVIFMHITNITKSRSKKAEALETTPVLPSNSKKYKTAFAPTRVRSIGKGV